MGIFNSWLGRNNELDGQDADYQFALNNALEPSQQELEDLANARTNATLTALQAKVLIVDSTNTIVSINPALEALLHSKESELRNKLPGFSSANLVGSKLKDLVVIPDLIEKRRESTIALGASSYACVFTPLADSDGTRLGMVLEIAETALQSEAEVKQQVLDVAVANTSGKLKAALDQMCANIMLVDSEGAIAYANAAMMAMLRQVENDIRKDLSGFSVANVLGSTIDIFSKNSSMRRELEVAAGSKSVIKAELGGRNLILLVSPVLDAQGSRLGTLLEWKDKTAELRFENSILATMENAIAGDLHGRVDAGSGSEYITTMANNINILLETFNNVIEESASALAALSEGKLTRKITTDFKGVYGKLKGDVNLTIDKLINVVNEIRECAGNVKSGAGEIYSGNTNLSQRTEQQAASLEETSSAMEEITSTVQQNAANAVQANTLARGARESAENGGDVVNNAVAAMQAISESSSRINDIIGVIDEIAFQTNLLALNAAVEAARAGDQGRGFAVVADEVRNLAGRSAKAAKEIKELIKDSGEKVKEGSRLVNKSGETLDEIVTAVKKVNDIVAEISTASDEQATGLDEINRAIGGMDDMTQQNAALVEEAAAASEALGEQAQTLERLISFFDLGSFARSIQPAVIKRPAVAPVVKSRIASRPASTSTSLKSRSILAKTRTAPVRPVAKPGIHKKPVDEDDKNWSEF